MFKTKTIVITLIAALIPFCLSLLHRPNYGLGHNAGWPVAFYMSPLNQKELDTLCSDGTMPGFRSSGTASNYSVKDCEAAVRKNTPASISSNRLIINYLFWVLLTAPIIYLFTKSRDGAAKDRRLITPILLAANVMVIIALALIVRQDALNPHLLYNCGGSSEQYALWSVFVAAVPVIYSLKLIFFRPKRPVLNYGILIVLSILVYLYLLSVYIGNNFCIPF